jgi:arylformamidase
MHFSYRYYDAEELNRQYDIRSTVPDIAPIMREYARRTAVVRQSVPCVLDVPYGRSPDERVDIFPSGRAVGPAPVFVFIHGGYWRMLDASDSGFMAEAFSARGACVVVVNYALAPKASIDDIVHQCREALAWTYRNIASYGGDPERIYVGGSSAGAHLSAMLLASDWQQVHAVPRLQVKGGLLLSGLYDLTPIVHTQVNEWVRLNDESARRNSPLLHLPAAGLSLIFTYAPNETDEFKRQTETYMAACVASGSFCEFVPVANSNHFDIAFEMARADSEMCNLAFNMMGI